MNKKQLVAKLSGSLNLSKADAERTFDTITNTILDALKNDDSVKIAGFGTYKVALDTPWRPHLESQVNEASYSCVWIEDPDPMLCQSC